MKSSQGSASLLVIRYALFLWSLPQWGMIGQSAKKPLEVPPVSCVLRCRTWHVSGVIFVKCFLFPFLPYSHFMCIYCVISIHIRYSPVYVWLLVMYHWLSVPNNGEKCSVRPQTCICLYIPCATTTVLLLMCLLLRDCHWDWLFANLDPFENLHLMTTATLTSCHIL